MAKQKVTRQTSSAGERAAEMMDGVIKTVVMLHDRCPDADTCATLAMLERVLKDVAEGLAS